MKGWGFLRAGRLPHPIPYQGSKRVLAPTILSYLGTRRPQRLYEPFAGSAAISIAAANAKLADEYVVSDSLPSLAELWQRILALPNEIAGQYERIWEGQFCNPGEHYNRIREEFNLTGDPAMLLYLLARCVKNAPRFNRQGKFNQSPDKRRYGMRPDKMRREILGAWTLLRDRGRASCMDFEEAIEDATSADLVYMDPPYQGVSTGSDRRYYQGVPRERLVHALELLNTRDVPFILSYDGRCGQRSYALPLSDDLAERIEIEAGISSQATLVGRREITVESIYVSRNLINADDPVRRATSTKALRKKPAALTLAAATASRQDSLDVGC